MAGFAAFKLFSYLRKRKRGARAETPAQEVFQPSEESLPLQRNLDEARQLLRLDEKNGRHPVHDALFGTFAEAELEHLISEGDQTAVKLRDKLNQRMNETAPLSTNS